MVLSSLFVVVDVLVRRPKERDEFPNRWWAVVLETNAVVAVWIPNLG